MHADDPAEPTSPPADGTSAPEPGPTGGPHPGVGPGDPLPDYAERVLDLVERIPAGRVMTYGDVAEWLGEGGPRQVGRVMSHYGGGVPWWRVVRADGRPLPGREREAGRRYREEGTPLRGAGRPGRDGRARLDTGRARWDGEEGT
ncbi:MGMT family protein [Streptomyces sp. ZYX-F-203]